MQKIFEPTAGLLIIYGCVLLGFSTKWQIGVAIFLIASGVALYARKK
jgi:hypothetical protein